MLCLGSCATDLSKYMAFFKYSATLLVFFLLGCSELFAQQQISPTNQDSTEKTKKVLEDAQVRSRKQELMLTIRNVDISQYPEVNVVVEAYNTLGMPIDTLIATELSIVENGRIKPVISVKKISMRERIPVDFVFLVDITGSMQSYIDGVRDNIISFTSSLVRRGIDYRVGLVLFTDNIEKVYPLTADVTQFLKWISAAKAAGGDDEPENALEALFTATKYDFKPAANRVAVIVTDAPYHQLGEHGYGTTSFTTNSIIDALVEKEMRVFCITPERYTQYKKIAAKTRGAAYDLSQTFAQILDNFSSQLTNLYAIKYRSDEEALPDSITIGILDKYKELLVKKTIPIVEIGRKLIIENLLFNSNSWTLSDSVPELQTIAQFMKNKPNVTVQIEGHTDAQGNDIANKKLSLNRAQAVKDYLVIKHKIEPKRIKTVGFGKVRPIASNLTDFGRKLNRRTEIVIVSK